MNPAVAVIGVGPRSFTSEDQRAFSRLSGDGNPVHLDPVYCQELVFGAPIVHGVHLVLWVLERVLSEAARPMVLATIQAAFREALPLETPAELASLDVHPQGFTAEVRGGHCRVSGRFAPPGEMPAGGPALPREGPAIPCHDRSFAESAAGRGEIPLYLDPDQLRRMFPCVATLLPPLQTAEILATSRLTGMECPGRHSIFESLDLRLAGPPGDAAMHYEPAESDERFSLVRLRIRGPNLAGILSAWFVSPYASPPRWRRKAT